MLYATHPATLPALGDTSTVHTVAFDGGLEAGSFLGDEGVRAFSEGIAAAAAVAAWHSKKREARQVAVSATRARYVTKPRGAPAGTVTIRKEKVLMVRPALSWINSRSRSMTAIWRGAKSSR